MQSAYFLSLLLNKDFPLQSKVLIVYLGHKKGVFFQLNSFIYGGVGDKEQSDWDFRYSVQGVDDWYYAGSDNRSFRGAGYYDNCREIGTKLAGHSFIRLDLQRIFVISACRDLGHGSAG